MLKKFIDFLKANVPPFLHQAARWVRYLYFMRFSLLLWIFPVVLVLLDTTGAKSLVSGLLVPEYFQGYLCVAFFLVSAGFVALISARVVVINGPARFGAGGKDEDLPTLLKTLLANDEARWEWTTAIGSQIWTAVVFWYLHANGVRQEVRSSQILLGLLCGTVLAIFLWYIANAWYYLTYDSAHFFAEMPHVELGKNAARTILFPRDWFFLNEPGKTPRRRTIEDATTSLKASAIDSCMKKSTHIAARLADLAGYRDPDGHLYEAHQFSIFAVFIFACLYATIWPLAAPVPAFAPSIVAIVGTGIVVLAIDWIFWSANKGGSNLLKWKIFLILGVTAFWLVFASLYFFTSAERFPILAMVLIMTMALCWTLAGVAFFADRYRLPVLTTIIVLMILPRISAPPVLPLTGDREEHYFSTVAAQQQPPAPVPTPAAVLDERWADPTDDRPLIVVTSTGGGLHASAWTVTVLAHLEAEFDQNDPLGSAEPFHKHLLLLSTVSGGSVGLLSYMREIQDPSPDFTRMQISAQCSSLEAVGWGLVYYDLQKAFLPVIPYFIPPSSGDGDLDGTPLFKDRTWSLRKAFARNLNNKYCQDTWKRDNQAQSPFTIRFQNKDKWYAQALDEELEKQLTLRSLFPGQQNQLPAFTINTTSVEAGNRFLLANYRVPHYPLDQNQTYPAQSFLDTFGIGNSIQPDLPLATAAQLSATFPYVSSATRVAKAVDKQSVHFVDGGYYDNDGTVSAIEFLRYALAPPEKSTEPEDQRHLTSIATKLGGHKKLRILWLEIRNSGDFDSGKYPTPGGQGASTEAWNLFSQVAAPPEGFWNAGNVGVTGRNRMALGLMDEALEDKLEIHRIILTDTDPTVHAGTDPLNWSLTPLQRGEVRKSAADIAPNYQEAKCWFSHWDAMETNAKAPTPLLTDSQHCLLPAVPQAAVAAAAH